MLCSGGPRYNPSGVSRGSPRLHFILMCMFVQLFVCCDRNKVQFNKVKLNFATRDNATVGNEGLFLLLRQVFGICFLSVLGELKILQTFPSRLHFRAYRR